MLVMDLRAGFPDSTHSAFKTVTGWTVEETLQARRKDVSDFWF